MMIKNKTQLKTIINQKINIAIKNTTKYFVAELMKCINDDYYIQYDPRQYERTGKLLSSVSYNILNGNTGQIYLDLDYNYKYASADFVANLAAQGYHGNTTIHTNGRFWESFKELYYNQLVPKLKENLKLQGLNIK